MKKLFLLILILQLLSSKAQIKYEKGYIIDNNDNKTDVLVRNLDWMRNPTSFSYKISESDKEKTGNIKDFKEFGAASSFKFVRFSGNVDTSPDRIDQLSVTKAPIWEEKQIYLLQVVSGNINLYSFSDGNIERYYYSKMDGEITPLIFKKYNLDGDIYKIAENDQYKSQLSQLFENNDIISAKVSKVSYNNKSLSRIFEEYNGKKEEIKNNKVDFNLAIRPGINFTSLKLDTHDTSNQVNFSSKTIFRIGLEAELVLPFNKNKWALLLEPTYFSYKNENLSINEKYKYHVDFSYIDLGLGLRHYMFINDNSKIFINASIIIMLSTSDNAKIYYDVLSGNYSGGLLINGKSSFFGLGAGYNFKNKFSAEIRYGTKRELFGEGLWNANTQYTSLIIGYNIF